MAEKLSPLELIHPDGFARTVSVLGSGCPTRLRPERPAPGVDARSELVVLAPTPPELKSHDWLDKATDAAVEGLAEDGVLYVLAPRRSRSRIARRLSKHGLEIQLTLHHDPDVEASRYLVPLSLSTGSYAFTNLIPTRRGRRRLALLTLAVPLGPRFLARTLRSVGFVARAPGARPLFDWAFRLDGCRQDAHLAVITTSWRGPIGSLVLLRFGDRARYPTAVAKISPVAPSRGALDEEATVLRRIGAAAQQAGADVPEPIVVGRLDSRPLMLQTVVGGRSAAAILGDFPDRHDHVAEKLIDWIERWNVETRTVSPLTGERLEHEVQSSARRLAPLLEHGDAYSARLEQLCGEVLGLPSPFVATHNDLTMVNIFISASGRLGVVDWEAARESGLPLVDFYYAIVDATAATTRYRDRRQAFLSCFAENGERARTTRRFEQRLISSLGIVTPVAELCFHACWLQYALHEVRHVPSSEGQAFLEILRSVAGDDFRQPQSAP